MQTLSFGSTGPDVKLLQSVLGRIGFLSGPVDGIFAGQTRSAVQSFQRSFGLAADGVVGPATWGALMPFILGYFRYTLRSGDTFFTLAQRYGTTISAIGAANPGVDPQSLQAGQQIIIPYGFDVVMTDIDYTYEIMRLQLEGLRARYPFLETGSIGRSVMGKELTVVRLGRGANEVSYNASHHANESITTMVLMKFIENFSRAYAFGERLRGYDTAQIFGQATMRIVPMVNPDGVDLVNYWPVYQNDTYRQAARLNQTGRPLPSVWKANIKGTDLNLNYPALWDKEHELELEQGITGPAPRDYGGPFPLSEPETVAMTDFTRAHSFRLVIAYHTQGEIIFYRFGDVVPPQGLEIAQIFSRASGYVISENPGEASYAGYKDWFIQDFNRPGYTVEVGRGVNPIPNTQFPVIYKQNEEILLLGGIV